MPHSLSVQFRRSSCRPHFSNLHRSDEETSFIEVVPMGVHYNISKVQPNWINLEPSTRQRLNQVHRNVMLAAITFNVATSLEPCARHGQPHIGVKSAQELRRTNKVKLSIKKPYQIMYLAAGAVGKYVSWSSWEQLREVCFTSQRGARNCTL